MDNEWDEPEKWDEEEVSSPEKSTTRIIEARRAPHYVGVEVPGDVVEIPFLLFVYRRQNGTVVGECRHDSGSSISFEECLDLALTAAAQGASKMG